MKKLVTLLVFIASTAAATPNPAAFNGLIKEGDQVRIRLKKPVNLTPLDVRHYIKLDPNSFQTIWAYVWTKQKERFDRHIPAGTIYDTVINSFPYLDYRHLVALKVTDPSSSVSQFDLNGLSAYDLKNDQLDYHTFIRYCNETGLFEVLDFQPNLAGSQVVY